MGGGALIQLVAYGAQDIYLTGQPQITFWKSVYRRHTNFSIESILLVPSDPPLLDARIEIPITRNADLLKRLWIQVNPVLLYPTSSNSVQLTTICTDFTHSLFKQLELTIGGQIIDRIYGVWLSIWRDLTENNPYGSIGSINTDGNRIKVQSTSNYNKMAYTNGGVGISISLPYDSTNSSNYLSLTNSDTECYIPLPFWFCKNPGLSIPLIALQYLEVSLIVKFSNFSNFGTSEKSQVNNNYVFNLSESVQFYGDYVYLDTVERRQFVNNSHEYLIEQLQKKSSQNQNIIKLPFKGLVKEIIIIGTPTNPFPIDTYSTGNYDSIASNNLCTLSVEAQSWNKISTLYFSNATSYNKPWIYSCNGIGTPNPIVVSNNKYMYSFANYNNELNDNISRTNVTLKLVLNGKDQLSTRNLKYFTRKTVWESHTGIGSGNWGRIAVIPFCLYSEDHQPSGGINFDIFSDARLIFDNFDSTINEQLNPLDIYAINYNILKVTSGMGGVIYSN
jgi:hypothetical protein